MATLGSHRHVLWEGETERIWLSEETSRELVVVRVDVRVEFVVPWYIRKGVCDLWKLATCEDSFETVERWVSISGD